MTANAVTPLSTMNPPDDCDSDDDLPPTLVLLAEPASAQPSIPPPTTTSPSTAPPCPVTILSGFLGSGKTTLIQYILQSPHHKKRIAVIENEFGEGLEIESLIARDGLNDSNLTDLIELPNGCVCCTVKDSLVTTLEGLLEKRNDLDYIIIECSGMANPGPLASLFWLDEALESRITLDGIVTLVDSVRIQQQLETTEEAVQQLAYADRIVLNKMDLLEKQQKTTQSQDDVVAMIRAINPSAQIQTTTFSKIPDLDWILDAKCYHGANDQKIVNEQVEELVASLASANSNDDIDNPHHDHDHHHHDHSHDEDESECVTCQQQQRNDDDHVHTSGVSTIALTEPGTVAWKKVNAWLAATLWPNQDEKDQVLRARLEASLAGDEEQSSPSPPSSSQQQIFRIKGILSVKHTLGTVLEEKEWVQYCDATTGIDRRRYILQAVYDLWDVHASSSNDEGQMTFQEDEERCCKVVVIGRYLQKKELQSGFRECLID